MLVCVFISDNHHDQDDAVMGECHDCTRRRGTSEINTIGSVYIVGTPFLKILGKTISSSLVQNWIKGGIQISISVSSLGKRKCVKMEPMKTR